MNQIQNFMLLNSIEMVTLLLLCVGDIRFLNLLLCVGIENLMEKKSLIDKSHKPLSPHPNSHTEKEIKWIKDLIKRNSHISMSELYGKLRIEKGYSRTAPSLFRVLRKMGFYINKEKHKKYVLKPYDTPTDIGIKWQMDVKYVPKECYVGLVPDKFYQYTMIDEASR